MHPCPEQHAPAPYGRQNTCRICRKSTLKEVLSLGDIPLANNLITKEQLTHQEKRFPLGISYCETCHLCQLSYVVQPEEMFSHYLYVTSTSGVTRQHFTEMAESIIANFSLTDTSLAVDIGSNDGYVLKQFKNGSVNAVGIEPAENLARDANAKGLTTLNTFFSKDAVDRVIATRGRADVITACNVFAHIHDIHDVVRNVKRLLKDNGVFVIEAQYVFDTLQTLTFDNIYHEHMSYLGILPLTALFAEYDMEIFKVEHFDNHGGSIRVSVKHKGSPWKEDGSVVKSLAHEKEGGLDTIAPYQKFARQVMEIKKQASRFITDIKNKGNRVVGYGAPAKATTVLNFFGIGRAAIECIVEDNPLKKGYFVPGVRIPIVGKETVLRDPPEYICILAWNYAEDIIKNNQELVRKGVKFFILTPRIKRFE